MTRKPGKPMPIEDMRTLCLGLEALSYIEDDKELRALFKGAQLGLCLATGYLNTLPDDNDIKKAALALQEQAERAGVPIKAAVKEAEQKMHEAIERGETSGIIVVHGNFGKMVQMDEAKKREEEEKPKPEPKAPDDPQIALMKNVFGWN